MDEGSKDMNKTTAGRTIAQRGSDIINSQTLSPTRIGKTTFFYARRVNIPVDIPRLRKQTKLLKAIAGVQAFDLSVSLTTDEVVHKLNKHHRNQDKVTDILSMQFHEV